MEKAEGGLDTELEGLHKTRSWRTIQTSVRAQWPRTPSVWLYEHLFSCSFVQKRNFVWSFFCLETRSTKCQQSLTLGLIVVYCALLWSGHRCHPTIPCVDIGPQDLPLPPAQQERSDPSPFCEHFQNLARKWSPTERQKTSSLLAESTRRGACLHKWKCCVWGGCSIFQKPGKWGHTNVREFPWQTCPSNVSIFCSTSNVSQLSNPLFLLLMVIHSTSMKMAFWNKR